MKRITCSFEFATKEDYYAGNLGGLDYFSGLASIYDATTPHGSVIYCREHKGYFRVNGLYDEIVAIVNELLYLIYGDGIRCEKVVDGQHFSFV